MTKTCWIWIALGCAACAVDDEPETTTAIDQGLYGGEGDYEFAVDAPWRLEPNETGPSSYWYDPIPITITITDAHLTGGLDDHAPILLPDANGYLTVMGDRGLGRVKSLQITEQGVGTFEIPLADLYEVERTIGAWPYPSVPTPPTHDLCRRWANESCASRMEVANASEWHATYFYVPRGQQSKGSDIRLDFALTVSQTNRFEQVWPGRFHFDDVVLRNQVSVHLGEAPLPRFDNTTWAYGDLHYHSQGTDNEGESGYGYRNVLHAMAAVGLDFALASEHASDSEQMVDIDLPPDAVFDEQFSGLRDMNAVRFKHLWHWLNDGDGANREIRLPLRLRAPQLFLGGEVDVVPETPAGNYVIDYGNGRHYDIRSSCARKPYVPFLLAYCAAETVHEPTPDGRWIVRDPQSRVMAAGRQHLLYLPHAATGDSGFVTSKTTKYGGGSRRLKDLVQLDFDILNKGNFFLAHPNDAAEDPGFGSLGPDIVPYSPIQYDDIFASQHFLGLQFWNSDARRTIDASFGMNTLEPWSQLGSAWQTAPAAPGVFGELHDGAATWDRLLLSGMDANRTRTVPWLAPGEPRKFFMAGGSDAHGDLNYRRKGYMVLQDWNWDIDDVTDTAIGTPRNLVHAGAPQGSPLVVGTNARRPFSQDQVFAAMARGEFTVTDGPALRIVWDVNENGAIDDSDVPMGGAIKYDPQAGPPTLLVQWKSTPEFGRFEQIQLYVGAAAGGRGLVYTVPGHGVRKPTVNPSGAPLPGGFLDETTGRTMVALDDGYWQSNQLYINPGSNYEGLQPIKLRPSDFRVGSKGSRVCKASPTGGPSTCFYRFDNPVDPEHLYVRAFAITTGRLHPTQNCAGVPIHDEVRRVEGYCIQRLAYTNPVWARPAHPMRASTLVDSNGRCVDVLNATTQNGAPIGMWPCNGLANQRWIYDNTGKTFLGLASKLLDALGWQSWDGAEVGLWDRDGAWNQQWTLRGVEIRGLDGKHLDVAGAGTNEGVSAVLARGDGSAHQRWTLTAEGELRSWDNRCLDVYGHWTHDGAPVLVYTCWGAANQKWRVLPGGMLQGTESGKCLAAQGDSSADGTQLVLAPCTGAAGQRWSMRGEIRAWNDKCLDVYWALDADGTKVQLYSCHGGPNQRFTLYP